MEDETNFKIRVKNVTESREVQKILLECGFAWKDTGKKINDYDDDCLFFYSDKESNHFNKSMIITKGMVRADFYDNENEEITLEKLRSIDFQKYLKKLAILSSLKE